MFILIPEPASTPAQPSNDLDDLFPINLLAELAPRHNNGLNAVFCDAHVEFARLTGVITEAKSNEIPAARQVLARLDLSGKIVLADALHTNAETAQQILYEQGADYLLTVKGNQPAIQETILIRLSHLGLFRWGS